MRVPTRYCEITVDQFQKLHRLEQGAEGLDKSIQLLSILTGKTNKEIEALPVSVFEQACAAASKLSTDQITPQSKQFTFEGRTFIPVPVHSWTAGQYIEIKEYSKDVVGNLPQLLASLVTEGGPYTSEGHKDRAEIFKGLAASIAYSNAVFFYLLFEELNNRFTSSSLRKIRKSIQREILFQRIGGFIRFWIFYRMAIIRSGIRSKGGRLRSFLTSGPMRWTNRNTKTS